MKRHFWIFTALCIGTLAVVAHFAQGIEAKEKFRLVWEAMSKVAVDDMKTVHVRADAQDINLKINNDVFHATFEANLLVTEDEQGGGRILILVTEVPQDPQIKGSSIEEGQRWDFEVVWGAVKFGPNRIVKKIQLRLENSENGLTATGCVREGGDTDAPDCLIWDIDIAGVSR